MYIHIYIYIYIYVFIYLYVYVYVYHILSSLFPCSLGTSGPNVTAPTVAPTAVAGATRAPDGASHVSVRPLIDIAIKP